MKYCPMFAVNNPATQVKKVVLIINAGKTNLCKTLTITELAVDIVVVLWILIP